TFTVADLPAICEIAKECIAEYNLEEQIEVKAVDIFTDEWPSGHDAVFFSNIFHDWGKERCTHLGQKSFEVLPSGGRIYLHELLLEDTRVSPPTLAVYSLGLSFATRGKLFTAGDLNELLTGWGFEDISITHTYGYHSLITGRKP
ncbi:MAG: ubiquinone/menaquinone biosynthesis protein, partial [Theionarchaea archaeon]|nr:ubiquinone/menaquinone biosynthesis protein [Theionarchaea archaeon]